MDYSGVQNTTALSEIAEVFLFFSSSFFCIAALSARIRRQTAKVRYSVQIRIDSKSLLLCTNKEGNSETIST